MKGMRDYFTGIVQSHRGKLPCIAPEDAVKGGSKTQTTDKEDGFIWTSIQAFSRESPL